MRLEKKSMLMDTFTKKATVELHISISFPVAALHLMMVDSSTSKQTKIDGQERQSRINDIVEKIADIDWKITYKQHRIDTCSCCNKKLQNL